MAAHHLRDLGSHKVFGDKAHPALQALGSLDVKHLPHLTAQAVFEAAEAAGVNDADLDRFETVLDSNAGRAAFSLVGVERSLLSAEVVNLFMLVAKPSSTMPNVIHINALAERLRKDACCWKDTPKLLNLAFCRLGVEDVVLKGIKDAVDVVCHVRRQMKAAHGLIVDLSVNELDDSSSARQLICSLAACEDIAFIVILGQELAKSIKLHIALQKRGHLCKVVTLLKDALDGVSFSGARALFEFARNTMTAEDILAYKRSQADYTALQDTVKTPKKLAEVALHNALANIHFISAVEVDGAARQSNADREEVAVAIGGKTGADLVDFDNGEAEHCIRPPPPLAVV